MSGISFGDSTLYDVNKGNIDNRLACIREKRQSNINAGIGVLTAGGLAAGTVYMAKTHAKGYNDIAKFVGKSIERIAKYVPDCVKKFTKDILNADCLKSVKEGVKKALKENKMLTKAGKIKTISKGKIALVTAGTALLAGTIYKILSNNSYKKGKIDQKYNDAQAITGAYVMGKADKGMEIASKMASRRIYM